jgi:small-conductance mechanosensitive channel
MLDFLQSPIVLKVAFSILSILVAYVLSAIIIRIITKSVKDLKRMYTARKIVIYVATVVCMVAILFIWVERTTSLVTILGAVAAGLTLALHQVILSIAGWLLILIRRPYEIGDRISIGEISGDVIDIRLFYTSLMEIGNWVDADQSTGRIVNCPNGKVFTESIFNYTRGFEFIWNEIKIVVTFESDWEKANDIILEVASETDWGIGDKIRKEIKKMSKKYMIHYEKLTPVVWVNIIEFGVELTLRYLIDARKRRSSQDEISQMILSRFNEEPDINFAYPTYRIYKKGEGSK